MLRVLVLLAASIRPLAALNGTRHGAHDEAKPHQVQHLQQRQSHAKEEVFERRHAKMDFRVSPDRNHDLRIVKQTEEHIARHECGPRDAGKPFGSPELAKLSQVQKYVTEGESIRRK